MDILLLRDQKSESLRREPNELGFENLKTMTYEKKMNHEKL